MSGEAWLYLFAVLINAVNLFLQVFFTIMYSDLEWYVHPPSVRAAAQASVCLQRRFRSYLKMTPGHVADFLFFAAVTTSTRLTFATA